MNRDDAAAYAFDDLCRMLGGLSERIVGLGHDEVPSATA